MSDLSIEKANIDDVSGIHSLLCFYSDKQILLPRTANDICSCLRDFYVVKDSGKIIACGALYVFNKDLGEIRSLAVDEEYLNMGLGKKLVEHIQNAAVAVGLSRLIALTYADDFFQKLGYEVIGMEKLPEKVWGICINCPKFKNCDEIAVIKYLRNSTR